MFSFSNFSENAGLRTLSLKSFKRTIKGFVLFNPYFRHIYPSPLLLTYSRAGGFIHSVTTVNTILQHVFYYIIVLQNASTYIFRC